MNWGWNPDNWGGNEDATAINYWGDGTWIDAGERYGNFGIIEVDSAPAGMFVFAEGVNTMTIAAGAIKDIQGTPVAAYSGSFVFDKTAPRIVASSVQQDQMVAVGDWTFSVTFSEPMDTNVSPAISLDGNNGNFYRADKLGFDSTGTVFNIHSPTCPKTSSH